MRDFGLILIGIAIFFHACVTDRATRDAALDVRSSVMNLKNEVWQASIRCR